MVSSLDINAFLWKQICPKFISPFSVIMEGHCISYYAALISYWEEWGNSIKRSGEIHLNSINAESSQLFVLQETCSIGWGHAKGLLYKFNSHRKGISAARRNSKLKYFWHLTSQSPHIADHRKMRGHLQEEHLLALSYTRLILTRKPYKIKQNKTAQNTNKSSVALLLKTIVIPEN